MKCQHCGADIKDGVLFCDVCGQPVSEPSSEETTIKKFWNAENNKKKEDIISDLAGLKGKSDEVQDVIIKGKKLKAKKLFFRIMLLFFVALVAVVAFTGYKVYETRGESYTNLLIASSLTLIVHLLFLTFSTIVANSGALKIFYLLIPVFGYFYFLYSFVCGLIRMIAPLKKDEKACVKEMNTKRTEFRILKKEEKNLKDGLDLIDKGILKSEALKDLRNPIVVEKKGTRGWLVTSVIAIIVLAVAFFAFDKV